ncbi:MAG: YHYH protein [Pseudomonadota bacterium]
MTGERFTKYCFVALASVGLAACGGGGGGSGTTTTPTTPTNTAPTVNAGADQTVTENTTVQLDATVTDTENDATLTWSQVSGPNVTLSATNIEDPSFTAPDVTATESIVLRLTADDGVNAAVADEVTITINDTPTSASGDWIVNTTNERSDYLMDGGAFVEVNVQSVTTNANSITVATRGVPNYTVTITQEALDVYEDRRAAAFSSGVGTLSVGDVVEWGEDVGYSATCTSGGTGWWPAGGASCPAAQNLSLSFPSSPTPATNECETGLGPVGLWVNGVPIYNWYDANSFNNENVWNQFAIAFRTGGMDLCYGHGGGANSQYHHHNYNACLRQLVGDDASGHSPIYGYAGDGYPIHGPYHAAGEISESCWFERDYSAGSATGCGTTGARTCTFVDEEDISRGTQTVSAGPSTTDTINFADNGNDLAVAGIYYEDFYYDAACTAQGEKYLDEHNGHDHDGIGYHYHTTTDANLIPKFPLVHGPDYYGDVSAGSFNCFNRTF